MILVIFYLRPFPSGMTPSAEGLVDLGKGYAMGVVVFMFFLRLVTLPRDRASLQRIIEHLAGIGAALTAIGTVGAAGMLVTPMDVTIMVMALLATVTWGKIEGASRTQYAIAITSLVVLTGATAVLTRYAVHYLI